MFYQLATTGPLPNTAFVSSLGSGVLSKRGYIIVKPTLQLFAHPSIYAAGDVIDWAEQKAAAKVEGHAKVVAANIISAIQGKPTVALYKGSLEMIVLTNGKVCSLLSSIMYVADVAHRFRLAARRTSTFCGESRWGLGSRE